MNIVVIGVGYVGLVTGLSLAKLGHKITFLDIDSSKISMLSKGTPTFSEPNLDSFLNDKKIKGLTEFFDTYDSIDWEDIDVVLICVQTPVDDSGDLNSIFIRKVFDTLEGRVHEETVVCVKSTIHPGAINEVFADLSMEYDDLVFNPEFLREGSAFEDFFQTERIIIGSNNKKNSEIIAKMYDGINSEVLFMNPISSQLVKYLSNAYLPMRLSFVNEASRLIDALDANQKDVLRGVGLDSRIGQEYFRPSPGWGGSCFPKDVSEVISISKSKNLDIPLISTIKESNENHKIWFSKYIQKLQSENNYKTIVLIGLAFKENTDDLRHSPTIDLFKRLEKNDVCIFDINFGEYNQLPISTNILDDSVIVEMYPLSGDLKTRVADEIKELKNYKYIKFWE